ncbi:MAG TPA: nucleoid-associated protein [Salinimicrobium sp.]|nr:nucleoid-associated protein [Salinimicrobium sp.]
MKYYYLHRDINQLFMNLLNIALHQVIKEQRGQPELNLSDHLLPVNDLSEEFVERLIESYSSKNPTYGVFEENTDLFPFQTFVQIYLEDEDFLEFSRRSMAILENKINVQFATGGYVVFVHYTHNQIDFLIVIMLDKSVQFSVDDENLNLRRLQSLDLDRMARAIRININKWQDREPQYLSFIKGTRQLSRYFIEFIGSTDMTSSKENSDRLRVALQSFMADNTFSEERKRQTFSRINDYAVRRYHADEDIELNVISTLVDDQNPQGFSEYIGGNDHLQVSGSFRVTQKAHLKFLERIVIKENGYSLEFDRRLKGTKIRIEGNNIIIRDVPADVIRNYS